MLQVQKGKRNDALRSSLWSKFWKIKVSSKVAHVGWRAITGILPTMSQLYTSHVPIQTLCQVCKVGEETILHALVTCSFASSCWQKALGSNSFMNMSTFKDWFEFMLSAYDKVKWEEIVMICWPVWNARNEPVGSR